MNAIRICHHPKYGSFCTAFFYRQQRWAALAREIRAEDRRSGEWHRNKGVRIVSFYSSRPSDAVDLGLSRQSLVICYRFDTPQHAVSFHFQTLNNGLSIALSYALHCLYSKKTSPAHDEMETA